jgi:hypothetical protein
MSIGRDWIDIFGTGSSVTSILCIALHDGSISVTPGCTIELHRLLKSAKVASDGPVSKVAELYSHSQ